MKSKLTRRRLLEGGAALAGAAGVVRAQSLLAPASVLGDGGHPPHDPSLLGGMGEVDLSEFDPSHFMQEFDYGKTSRQPDGRVLREWDIVAVDKEIEVAPGVFFPAWTYNGQVPGPTLRCTEGDRLRVHFSNGGSHPHTIHFHGFHPADMDGVFEVVNPGQQFIYEFDADPMGLHVYHCHTIPLKRHIHKGLYGTFIVDPKSPRPDAQELVMVMNGFDTNLDGDNEIYAVNSVAFHHQRHPVEAVVGRKVRIYLSNMTEFDLINSFHIHGHFFDVFRTGTRLEPDEFTDTLMLCQGERHILEMTFKFPGKFMFHAHQSEFAELGWMGLFEVKESA